MINNPGDLGYQVYAGTFTQIGTDPPTPRIFQNTIGNIIWTANNAYTWFGTLNGAFPADRVFVQQGSIINDADGDWIDIMIKRFSDNQLIAMIINITTSGYAIQGQIDTPCAVEIRVYP